MKIAENINKIKNKNIDIKEARNKDVVLWPSFDDVIGAPGNRMLLAGTMQAGWFGEVPSSDFIRGDELANLVGITAGVHNYTYDNEPWLKFAYEGNILLVSKKPIRWELTWNQIYAANCVYGDRIVNIKGKKYKIMLLRGISEEAQENPRELSSAVTNQNWAGWYNKKSMWNKLMLPIMKNAETNNWYSEEAVEIPVDNWGVGYETKDIAQRLTEEGYTFYVYSWCQEVMANGARRCLRGEDNSYCRTWYADFAPATARYGWRPALKLIG